VIFSRVKCDEKTNWTKKKKNIEIENYAGTATWTCGLNRAMCTSPSQKGSAARKKESVKLACGNGNNKFDRLTGAPLDIRRPNQGRQSM